MTLLRNNKGVGIMEVVMASSIVLIIVGALSHVLNTMYTLQADMFTTVDYQSLALEANYNIKNSSTCDAVFGLNETPATAVTFEKIQIDDENEGLDVELWSINPTTNLRHEKRFSGIDSDYSSYSKLNIESIKLIMPNARGLDYPASPAHYDIGKISIRVTSEKSYGEKMHKPIEIPIGLKLSTNSSGVTTILSCGNNYSFGDQNLAYFGGMYGNEPTGTLYNNPLTGAKSCPSGYSSVQVFGSDSLDHSLYFCYRKFTDEGVSPVPTQYFAFGGAYGDSATAGMYVNPFTGAKDCPAGYTQHKTLGTVGMDYGFYFCYKNLGSVRPNIANSKMFSGFFGYLKANGIGSSVSSNPMTGSASCPPGTNNNKIFGTHSVDWPIILCAP